MRRYHVLIVVLGICLLKRGLIEPAQSLGSGFTYQGQLQENGDPAPGPAHLRFSLWDAAGLGQPPLGGAQIGARQLLIDVPVTDGVFTVVLNAAGEFGPDAFNGEGRWLQIEVCADPGCSSLSILSPRQPLTGAPYALTAVSAPWSGLIDVPEGFADNVDNMGDPVWEKNGSTIFYNAGSVSIGTATPGAKFQVNDGRIRIRESATLERWDFFYNPPDQKFYLQENAAYNHLVFTKGPDSRVGIGTHTPNTTTKLHVVTNGFAESAVRGESTTGSGVTGIGSVGVIGHSSDSNGIGVRGVGMFAVEGAAFDPGSVAIYGYAVPDALAGKFIGNIDVSGMVLKSGDSSRIDHPLDPANKYLFHSSIESPDRMNVYNGNVVLNDRGEAEVTLPNWFMALNNDFRYQLTPLGAPGANLHVAQEIVDGRFRIGGGSPGLKVSWQVTGIRHDAWAKAHPVEVEKAKADKEVGKYLTPELFGQPKEMGIHYRPEMDPSSETALKVE